MGKQTSRMYGIKVKERVNYYEFGNEDGKITLSFDNGTWTVSAGGHNDENPPEGVEWWMNGTQFQNGATILTFNDGDVVSYTIGELHKGAEGERYVWYMYDVFGNANVNPDYGNKEKRYLVTSGSKPYSCKVYCYENNFIKSAKEFTNEDIENYKQIYSSFIENPLYKVYGLLFDWLPYPDMSFKAIANNSHIKYNETTYSKGDTIKIWQAYHHDPFESFEVLDESDKYTPSKSGEEDVPTVHLCKRKGGSNICNATKDRTTIYSDVFHDHKEAYYNGKYHKAMYLVYDNPSVEGCWKNKIGSLAVTYADPYWFLMTTQSGIEYNGTTYEARKLLRVWDPDTSVNMRMRQVKSRRRPSPDKTENYDELVYDIQHSGSSDEVLVTKQRVVYTYDPVTERKVKTYEDLDHMSFTPADSPVNCYNLRFVFNSSLNKWTIYSKCGYIKFGGRLYPTNRSILSFGAEEDLHIEIKDETNLYIVESITTYEVSTPDSDVTVTYSVHTPTNDKCIKIIKTVGNEEEPWITLQNYEAMYVPVECYDIAIRFNNKSMTWELYSNSDNLYYMGTNYEQGEQLASWGYNDKAKISGITVTHPDNDALKLRMTTTVNGKNYSNQDVDEDFAWYDEEEPDFNVSFSYTKGLWTVTALHDCWSDGIQYIEGTVIKQWKTKNNVDRFVLLFQHFDYDDPEEPINVVYGVESLVDPITGVTGVTIDSTRHPSVTLNDKDGSRGGEKVLLITKEDSKSMYGYIWKKFESPGPTPTPDLHRYYFIPICFGYATTSGNGYRYIAAVRVEFGHRYVKRLMYNGVYMRINLIDNWMQADDPNDSTLFLTSFSTHVMNYRFVPSYSGGPTNESNWSFVNGTSSFPPYPYNNSKYQGLNAYYKKGGSYYYISLLARYGDGGGGENDKYLISKIEFTDNRYYQVRGETESSYLYTYIEESIGEPGNFAAPYGFYNGKRLYNNEGFAYLDKGDYFLISSSLIATGNTYDENLYCTISVNLSSMSMTLVHKINFISNDEIKNIILTNDDVDIVERYTYDYQPNEAVFMIGKYRFYIVNAEILSYPKEWHGNNYRKSGHGYVAYKYDIEEGSLTYLGTCTIWGTTIIVDAQTGERFIDAGSDNRPWRIPDVVSDGVGYCYYTNNLNDEQETIYEIWEISNPNDFDSIYNGATKVCEYYSEDTVQIINLQWCEYEEFYVSSFIESRTIDAKYYDELIEKFMPKSSKKGIFKYAFIQNRTAIFYFPDPTFRNVNGAFMFYADALRTRTELNEEWFSTPQSN